MTVLDAPPERRLDVASGARSQAALTRLARRTARGGGWRHLLVVALIALSVAAATAVAIGARSSRPSPAQELAWRFGAGDLRVERHDTGEVTFAELPHELQSFIRDAGLPIDTADPAPEPAALIAGFAPDARIVSYSTTWTTTATGHGMQLIAADPTDPLIAPMWSTDGPAPAPGEALLSSGAMSALDAEVGDVVELPLVGRVDVVGEIVVPRAVRAAAVLVHPDADLAGRSDRVAIADIDGDPTAVAERLFTATNEHPIGVEDRRSMAAMFESGTYRRVTEEPTFIGTLIGAVLLAQVAFVAAAAFATGIRRRLRELGLLGATGADPAQVQGLVLREALVLGLAGGIVGAGLGVLAAWLGRPVIQLGTDQLIDRLAIHFMDLVAPAALGTLAALVAAFLPARTAGRVPVVTALAGRLPVRSVPRWVTPTALVTAAGGLILVAVGVRTGVGYGLERDLAVAVGTVATVLGAAALAVPVLGLVARFAERLPARWRLVIRDTVRQRSRSAAAVAALTVALTVPVVVATTAVTDAQRWQPAGDTRSDLAVVTGPWYEGGFLPPTDQMVATAEQRLPAVESRHPIPHYGLNDGRLQATFADDADGGVVQIFDQIGIATPSLLAALGLDLPPLAGDQVAVLASHVGHDGLPAAGTAQLRVDRTGHDRNRSPENIAVETVDVIRADTSAAIWGVPQLLVSSELADRLGFVPVGGSVLLDLERHLTAEDMRAVQGIGESERTPFHINVSGNTWSFDPDPMIAIVTGLALLVALIISGMTAALAATESDRDLELMTAIGAEPRIRRQFHARQSGYHALVAALLAVPTGLLLSRVVTIATQDGIGIVIPWRWLAAILVLVPVAIALAHRTLMRRAKVRPPRRIT